MLTGHTAPMLPVVYRDEKGFELIAEALRVPYPRKAGETG